MNAACLGVKHYVSELVNFSVIAEFKIDISILVYLKLNQQKQKFGAAKNKLMA